MRKLTRKVLSESEILEKENDLLKELASHNFDLRATAKSLKISECSIRNTLGYLVNSELIMLAKERGIIEDDDDTSGFNTDKPKDVKVQSVDIFKFSLEEGMKIGVTLHPIAGMFSIRLDDQDTIWLSPEDLHEFNRLLSRSINHHEATYANK